MNKMKTRLHKTLFFIVSDLKSVVMANDIMVEKIRM